MFKKVFFLIALLFFAQQVFANEVVVKVTPKIKYSTCKNIPQVGDFIDFVTTEDVAGIKKGTLVQGLLTEKEDNGFAGKVASYYIEQFKVNGKNLSGTIYQKGNPHQIYFDYFDWLFAFPVKLLFLDETLSYVRGGEAFLIPEKDVFTLYLKD